MKPPRGGCFFNMGSKEIIIGKDTVPNCLEHQGEIKLGCGKISIDDSGRTVCSNCGCPIQITEKQEKQSV